jgi:integrase
MPRQPRPRRVLVTRWVMPDGTRVARGTAGARRVRERSRLWYAVLPDPRTGKRKLTSLGTEDEGVAWAEFRRRLRLAGDVAAGIVDASHDHARTPLTTHLDDYCQVMRDRGTSDKQVAHVRSRLLRLFPLAGWSLAGHLTPDTLLRGLRALRAEGRGAQTRNHYRAHALGFSRWLRLRVGRHALDGVEGKANVEADPRHPRRCPSDAEVAALFAALDGGPVVQSPPRRNRKPPPWSVRRWMTSRQRALGYRVCMATGFRAGELRSLTRESFDLDEGTATVEAAYSKHRRRDTQHLPPWLVAMLREWFAADGGLWEGFSDRHTGETLIEDLAEAGVPYRTREGFLDFHSLRVWFVTAAAHQPGISPKTLMQVCRHSSAHLSLKVYARARVADARAVATNLPDLSPPSG